MVCLSFLATAAKPLKSLSELQKDLMNFRFGMFIHFSPTTYLDLPDQLMPDHATPHQGKDGVLGTADDLSPSLFNPVKLDCGQWADAAKSAGMKFSVLTTKHHDGFCLWDSKTTTYDVASSAVGRDIVREFCDAFRSRGIEPHFYFSIWDRQLGIEKDITEDEILIIKAQLKELLTNYGNIGSITFDGWGNCGTNWKQAEHDDIYNFIKSIQPRILNSDHYQLRRGLPLDSVYKNLDFFHFEEPFSDEWAPPGNKYAAQQGPYIQSQWFWKKKFPEEKLMSVDNIVNRHLAILKDRRCNFCSIVPLTAMD